MIKTFIDRPVLSTVITIFMVLLGVLGIYSLPVTQYPDIAPPTVQIQANYTGASAETVLESVIIPIEEEVNGVENMTYINSSADNTGAATITVYFEQGVDPDIATVNVQNRVARATPLLPEEVNKRGVVTQKQQTSALMFITFYSTVEDFDDVYIQNYMNINIIPPIKRISGVGDAKAFGIKDYAMRIWLDPAKLTNYGLVPSDVIAAINEQSQQATPGQIGQNSGKAFQYVINYSGKYSEAEQYKNIVVKVGEDGEILRVADVAEVELSAFSFTTTGKLDGHPAVSMAIYQTPGSNAQKIIEEVKAQLIASRGQMPAGIDYDINYDTNEFLTASMEEVIKTLFEAFILVFIVVFIFLQDFRSTLIPAIAVPVSIIGTFFFLNVFGFSINLLTLFALILAIGIVVDDAIVVVEAVHANMEKKPGKDIKDVTNEAMESIFSALISITLVMIAVFIPVTFISGPTGVFYKQFGVTLAIAIVLSAINALTLSPMLCALLLKPHEEDGKTTVIKRFYAHFNVAFAKLTERYGRAVAMIINQKWIALLLIAGAVAAILWANATTPTGFVPNEDRKIIFSNVELPPGSSMDRTYQVMEQLNAIVSPIPGVDKVTYMAGFSLINGAGSNYGLAFIQLTDWEERKGDDELGVVALTRKMFAVSQEISDAKVLFFNPPSIPGYGISSGFEMQVLDQSGGTAEQLASATQEYMAALTARPEVQYSQSSFNTNYPQYDLRINVDLAKQKGVSINDIFASLSGYVGGIYAADFTKFGKQYKVMVQAAADARDDMAKLNSIYVRTKDGEMSPINEFIHLEKISGPQSVQRFNLFSSAMVSGAPASGYSTGDAINAVREVATDHLPAGMDIDFSGLTREEISAGSQTVIIFIISLIFVYLLLSAQYESYVLPLAIMFTLPLGVSGAYISQKIAGLENNIFFQIALIMLIGLLAKNAILIVEFALQERQKGNSIVQAAVLGAKERLRPILMTSFAFVLGVMPLVMASGVGANGNRSLATGAAFGLLVGTIFGLLVIPVLFVIFQSLQEKIKPIKLLPKDE